MLNLFKKKQSVSAWSYTVPYSNNFRGYKRLKLDTYKDVDSETGLKALQDRSSYDHVSFAKVPNYDGINVFIDDHKAGTIWRDSWTEYYDAIFSEKVEKAHLKIEGNAYLYIKF